ncbi:hypothetical protein D3C85_817030 [compost metagenome]
MRFDDVSPYRPLNPTSPLVTLKPRIWKSSLKLPVDVITRTEASLTTTSARVRAC